MHDASAVGGRHVVVDEDAPRGVGAPDLGVGVIVEQPVVVHVAELFARERALDGGGRRRGILVAELLRVVAEQVGGQKVPVRLALGGALVHVGRSERAARHDDVLDVGADGEREVRREGPRGRRPGERAHAGEAERLGLDADEGEGDRDRRILPHLVDVVVHAQLVVRQGGLVAPAVRQHAVALVGEALVPQVLEGPQHRLHVAGVEGLVAALEVDPARLAGDVVLPLLGVLEHRLLRLRVEGADAHLLDLALLGDAELLHRLELGRQAVRVPAEDAVDLLAAHRLEPREEVLRIAGQQMPVVRKPVGERWAVVEDPLVGALALRDRCPEGVVGCPEREHLTLDLGEARARRDGVGRGVGGRSEGGGARVGHVSPAGASDASCEDDPCCRTGRGTTPLALPDPTRASLLRL